MTDARSNTLALQGRWHGSYGVAFCPAHPNSRTPALRLRDGRDGRLLAICATGCSFTDVVSALTALGLQAGGGREVAGRIPASGPAGPRCDDEVRRTEVALAVWRSTIPADGTPVATYLAARGLTCPPPPSLRFHPGLRHPSGGVWPCMVGLVTRGTDDTPMGIHRTFLSRTGAGKAPLKPARMMLGPCSGGSVRLAPVGDVLMVGEGVETCLAAMQATAHVAWAALSTSGLRALDLPEVVREVIILADGDDAGEAAARDAALRWTRQGRRVRIARAPRGKDFNDLLMDCTPRIRGGA